MNCRGSFEERCSEDGEETPVGARESREVLRDVVAAAGWAAKEPARDFEEQFVGEGEEWHGEYLDAEPSGYCNLCFSGIDVLWR